MLYFNHKVSETDNLCFREHTTLAPAQRWWAHQDSNLEPKDYEFAAIT